MWVYKEFIIFLKLKILITKSTNFECLALGRFNLSYQTDNTKLNQSLTLIGGWTSPRWIFRSLLKKQTVQGCSEYFIKFII